MTTSGRESNGEGRSRRRLLRGLPGPVIPALRTAGLWLLLAACLVGWVIPQQSIDYRRDAWPQEESLLFLPTGDYVRVASLGFHTVLADALYLWSIQYYGHHRTDVGRQYLWRIFDVITDLDPRNTDAYLTGALIMAMDMGDPRMAIRLLEKGFEERPDEWILPFEAGAYCWLQLDEPQCAADWFERALDVPGAPAMIRRARAGMFELGGDRRTALRMWADIYEDAVEEGNDRVESIAWQHVYDLKTELDLETLRDAVARFRADRGRPPRVLGALATQGYVDAVPTAPDGSAYEYDPVTGEVTDPGDSSSRAGR